MGRKGNKIVSVFNKSDFQHNAAVIVNKNKHEIPFFMRYSVLEMWQLFSLFSIYNFLFFFYRHSTARFEANMWDIWAWHSVNRQAITGTRLSAVCLMPCLL